MNLYLYNNKLEKIDKISRFKSLIWVRRYNEAGEFELYIPAGDTDISKFEEDQFLIREDDETVMIVEHIGLPEDELNGDFLIVSGRSAESLLTRRVNQSRLPIKSYKGIYNASYDMVNNNFIDTAEERKIDLITLKTDYDADDPIVAKAINVSSDRFGAEVYENIKELCKTEECGFRMNKVQDKLQLSFYYGTDRSALQYVNPKVEFKPEFGNLVQSEYLLDTKTEKNSAFVAGEGEGTDRKTIIVGDASGLERKEMFVDARDISSTSDEKTMTEEEYKAALEKRANEKLSEASATETFDFEIDITRTYQYKKDFIVGDIVTCKNKYGIEATARIIEMSEIFDEQGTRKVPKMEGVKKYA